MGQERKALEVFLSEPLHPFCFKLEECQAVCGLLEYFLLPCTCAHFQRHVHQIKSLLPDYQCLKSSRQVAENIAVNQLCPQFLP